MLKGLRTEYMKQGIDATSPVMQGTRLPHFVAVIIIGLPHSVYNTEVTIGLYSPSIEPKLTSL